MEGLQCQVSHGIRLSAIADTRAASAPACDGSSPKAIPGSLGAEQVTSSAALEAARKHVLVDGMRVIAVGDRSKIEPKLRALQLGTIEYRDTDGNLIADKKK